MGEVAKIIRKRLSIRAWRRGTREMDLILGRFAEHHLAAMDPAALGLFESLLKESDTDLSDWIFERSAPPAQFSLLIAQIRSFGRGGSHRT